MPSSTSWSRAVGGALPGDFPAWQTVYTYFRNWRKDGTWVLIHDRLREWTRIEADRQPSPSEAVLDSQSVKTAAGVSEDVGFDSAKLIKGRKRFISVETLGLVLRAFVTAASVGELMAANGSSSESNAWTKRCHA